MMEKIDIGANVSLCPMPVTLVGAKIEGKANFMAVAWASRVNAKPPMLAVAINKSKYTPTGIRENRTFSVNLPGADLMAETDYCGIVSGRKTDKSKVFDIFYGETGTAPMIETCPLCIECRLFEIYELPSNCLYVVEILAAYSEEKYLTDGQPDVRKMNPMVLTMPDNGYWGVGDYLGKAWGAGMRLMEGRD